MIQGDPRLPCVRFDRAAILRPHMTSNDDTERGEKRGVLSTGRAQKLGKTKDADAESDRADEEDDAEE